MSVSTAPNEARRLPRGSFNRGPHHPPIPDVPALAVIVVYCLLLFNLPSRLIIRQIGAPGTPANLWGITVLMWWICFWVGGRIPSRHRNPVRAALGLLVLAVLVSYATAMVKGWYAPPDVRQRTDDLLDLAPTTLAEIQSKMIAAADRGLLSFAGWVGIVLVTVDGMRSWTDLQRLTRWVTTFVGVVAAMGVVQYLTGFDLAALYRIPGLSANSEFGTVYIRSVVRRVMATAGHPIEFGVVVAGVFPLALHRVIYDRRSIRDVLVVVAIAMAIPMSVSRSAIIVLAVTMTVMFVGWPGAWRRRGLLIAPVAVVAMRLMFPGLLGTIKSLFTNLGNDDSVSGRTEDYDIVFRVFQDSPWLGRGLFTFVPRYYRIIDNQYLMTLVELGVAGLMVLTLFFFVGYFCARGARRRAQSPENRHLALALSASIAGIVLSFITFDALSYPMISGLTFLLIGMAGAAWRISKSADSPRAISDVATRTLEPLRLATNGSKSSRPPLQDVRFVVQH